MSASFASQVASRWHALYLAAVRGCFDFIIDAVSAKYDLGMYLSLLATNGMHILLGAQAQPFGLSQYSCYG
jgi:uncharacterized zinc-type alcohol dehydrogenase-like protein